MPAWQLRKAIKGNYCSYPAMDKDPLFDPIRQRPDFAELTSWTVANLGGGQADYYADITGFAIGNLQHVFYFDTNN
ncbi:MAG: hypothetical protein WBX03_06755 [Terriglobales bacterium]